MELIRFLVVGATNTALTLAAYWSLLHVTFHTLAYLAAFVVGVAYTAAANARFTFRSSPGPRALAAYALFCVVQYGIGAALLELFVTILGVSKYLAIFGVIAIGIPIGFLGARYILKQ